MNRVIYPGSFDPITNGHLDIIKRSIKMFNEVHVVVMHNPSKRGNFSVEERIELIKDSIKDIEGNIIVTSFDGLMVDYCEKSGIYTVVRGLRALTDFDYEFQMALTNRQLKQEVESVLLVTNIMYSYVSSSLVMEIASFNGDVSHMVPENVNKVIIERMKNKKI